MDKKLFNRLLASVEEMVAIEKGEIDVPKERIHTFEIPDVRKIRVNSNLKQIEFAEMLGVSLSLVQSWELNRRVPNGPALKLLTMIERQPQLVEELRSM
ncbi:transcriptional regulator [Pasteurellaceae bacterium 15-036681]|nr:transcriptional regulator [Pasteurellaceae bacterium 15-036681]